MNFIYKALACMAVSGACMTVFADASNPDLPVVQPPRIAETGISPEGEFQLTITGAPGEYRIEVSDDLQEWNSWRVFGFDGEAATLSDPESTNAERRFYQLDAWLTADGFHISGPIAQALAAALTGQLEQMTTLMLAMSEPSPAAFDALGIDFNPTEGDLLAVDSLESGNRNARIWTAVVGSLSVLGQELRDHYAPDATAQKIAEALNTDLASGKLDGMDENKDLITIGEDGPDMPSLSPENFLNAFNNLQEDMSGLDNLVFTINDDGTLAGAIPSEWNNFHWDGADWQ